MKQNATLNFLTSLYRILNDRKSAIIYLDWPDIGWTVPDR